MKIFKVVATQEESITIAMCDDLTFQTIKKASIADLLRYLRRKHAQKIIVDCQSIRRIDSCGLALLTEIQLYNKKCETKFINQPEHLLKLAELYLNRQQKLQ